VVLVEDFRAEERFSGSELLTSHGVTSGVTVPIGPDEELWGVLGTYTTEKRGFTEHETNFLWSVANVLATAIESQQTKAEIEETEQFLRDAKSQLEAATDAGAVGTWEWRVQTDEMVVGPSFAETFGVDPEAAREGVSLDQFIAAIHDDDRERVERAIEEALATCGEYEAEYRVWNAADELRWVVARGRVECDEDGTPVTFPGALTDITERKRAELERRRSKEQLESLFEILPVGVIVADADGHIVRANEAARRLAGTGLDDAESIAEYHQNQTVCTEAGEPVDSAEWTISRVLDGETVTHPNPDVYEIGSDDGESRIVRVTEKPVRNGHGDVTRGVVTLTDITERRGYERKLEKSNEQLDQFAHAVSHDLQEPLRMVSGYLELLDDRYADDLDGDAKEFMNFAVEGAERMSAMIQGLLEYSRIDTRGAPFKPVELDDVLADVRDTLRMRIEESDAHITADPLPRVEGDAGQLQQLFQNLLDNAIEYSGDDPPRIRVTADRDGAEWTISVSDE
jgi:PAS domain S-box-containing protein